MLQISWIVVKYTLLQNLKLCPKIKFFGKIDNYVNLNFRAKNWWNIVIQIDLFLLEFEFSLQNIVIIQQNLVFGAKIQNYLGISKF